MRPKSEQTKHLYMKITPELEELIKKRAEELGFNKAVYIRHLISKDIEKKFL